MSVVHYMLRRPEELDLQKPAQPVDFVLLGFISDTIHKALDESLSYEKAAVAMRAAARLLEMANKQPMDESMMARKALQVLRAEMEAAEDRKARPM